MKVKRLSGKRIIGLALGMMAFLLSPSSVLAGGGARLKLNFDKLADKADEVVEVTLDRPILALAARFLNENDADEAAAKELVRNLEGVYVRSFSFEEENAYTEKDVKRIFDQLEGWQKVVSVRSKKSENTGIFMLLEDGKVAGIAIVAVEPTEFTVVNIVGSIDLAKLSDLDGQFGIPDMDLEVDEAEKGATP